MTGACDAPAPPATLSWADRAKAQAAAPAAAAAATTAPKKPAAKMSWVDFARCTPPALPLPATADEGSVVAAPYAVVAGKAAGRRKGGGGSGGTAAASKKTSDASGRSPYEIFSDQPVPTSPATPAVAVAAAEATAAAAAVGGSSSSTSDNDAAAAAAAPPLQQPAAGSKKKEKKGNSKKEKKKKAEADEAAAATAEAEAAVSTPALQDPEAPPPPPSTPPTQPAAAAAAADTATPPEAAAAAAAAAALEPAPEADAEVPEQEQEPDAPTTGGTKKKKKKKKKKGNAATTSTPADAAAEPEPPATPPSLPSPQAGGEKKEQDHSLSPVSLCSPATPVSSDRGRLVAEAFAHDSDDDDDFFDASAAQPQATAAATQPTASLLAIQEDHVPTPAADAPLSPPAQTRQGAAGRGNAGGKKADESSPSPSTAAAAARTPSGDGSPVSLVGGDSCGPSSAGSFQDVSAAAAAAAAARRQYSTTCLPTCLTMDSLKDDEDYTDLPSGQQAVAAAAAAAAAAAQSTSAGEFPSPCQYIPLRPVREAEDLLRVRVTQARRVTGEGRLSHWMYRTVVRTRSAMYAAQPQVDGGAEVEVEKRYSDFAWLHATLTALYPSVPVPPIPTAAAAGTMDKVIEYFSPESSSHAKALDDPAKLPLVQERLHLLALFCGHLGSSPLFAASELLRRFLLTPSGPELEAFKQHTTQRIGEGLLLGESTEEVDRAAAAGHASGSAATAAAWVGRLYHTIRGDSGGDGGGEEARARMPAHVLQKREKTAVTREALSKMHRACEGALRAEAANRNTATAMLAGQGYLATRTAAKAASCPEDDAAAAGGGGSSGLSLTPVSSILDPLSLWANLSRSVPLLGGGSGGGDEAFAAAKPALPASSSLLRLPADSPGDPNSRGQAAPHEGGCGGGGASSAATTLTTLSAQIGCRVVDATGHGGTVRWAGTLAMAPLADLTYIGVLHCFFFSLSFMHLCIHAQHTHTPTPTPFLPPRRLSGTRSCTAKPTAPSLGRPSSTASRGTAASHHRTCSTRSRRQGTTPSWTPSDACCARRRSSWRARRLTGRARC